MYRVFQGCCRCDGCRAALENVLDNMDCGIMGYKGLDVPHLLHQMFGRILFEVIFNNNCVDFFLIELKHTFNNNIKMDIEAALYCSMGYILSPWRIRNIIFWEIMFPTIRMLMNRNLVMFIHPTDFVVWMLQTDFGVCITQIVYGKQGQLVPALNLRV